MSFELVREQQKAKAGEISARSISVDQLADYLNGNKGGGTSSTSTKSNGGTGNFIADLTAALDAYSSNTKTLESLPTIKAPGGKGIGKFFYNIFTSKSKRKENQAKYDKEREEQEAQKQELNESIGNALTMISSLMSSATQADKKNLIANEAIVRRLMTELPEVNKNAVLDLIYKDVDDSNKTLLMDMIESRFGLPILDSSSERINRMPADVKRYLYQTEYRYDKNGDLYKRTIGPQDWSLAALQHIYGVYLTLPPDHMKLVRCLMHFKDDEASGAAWGSAGIYFVNYHKGKEDGVEGSNGGTCCSSANDMRHGMNELDLTIAHELGHVVDGRNNNFGYSRSVGFRKWSAWVQVSNTPSDVVKFMKDSMTNKPYGGTLTDKELALTNEIAEEMVSRQSSILNDWSLPKSLIETKIKANTTLSEDSKASLKAKLTNKNDIEDHLLYHIWAGFGGHGSANLLACYNFDKVMKGMKRPFYQGYSNDAWFSFDKSRWSTKISAYQYRCPKEEFAETYASYHMAPTAGTHVVNGQQVPYKKGDKTPEGLKKWFEEVGLHQAVPSKVSGSSSIQEQRA